MEPIHEKSLIIIKPDAVQRNLIGEIISRIERKGLKIIGIKMILHWISCTYFHSCILVQFFSHIMSLTTHMPYIY